MKNVYLLPIISVGLGILWRVWDLYGFWWGLLYGMFWEVWIGYRFATWMLAG